MKIALRMFIVLLLATSTTIGAEYFAGPEYNHKLWRISGNGLKKDSYIFVMYNTSNKKVFMLEDSIYAAFKKVDVIIHYMHYFDKDRNIIPEIKQYDYFDFEKYFSPEKLKEIEDSVEARGGYFKKAINSRSSYQLFRNLNKSKQYQDINLNYKTDIGSEIKNLSLLESKFFDGIFDINYFIEYFQSLSDENKVTRILELLDSDTELKNDKLYSKLYTDNNLDSIFNLMVDDYKAFEFSEFNKLKDSTYNFVIKYLGTKSLLAQIPINLALGNDGLIDKLKHSGYLVEPIICETFSDLNTVIHSYRENEWTKVKIEKFGIDVSLPKLYLNGQGIGVTFGYNFMDISSNMGYFVEVYDVPDFTITNPIQYFHEANLKMRANYSENINLKQIYTSDSLLKFEFETKRNKYFQKYHLVYFDKKIFKLTVISDTLNLNLQHADKFLSSYKIGKIPVSNKYLYTSPSKDFQIEFPTKPQYEQIILSGKDSRNYELKSECIDNLSFYMFLAKELPKSKFFNEDDNLVDNSKSIMQNKEIVKKQIKYKSDIVNYKGFSSLDFSYKIDSMNVYFKTVLSFSRFYIMHIHSPNELSEDARNEYFNSLKITLNHDTPMKIIETETAKFKLPENMVRDSLIEDFRNMYSLEWGDCKYFIRQDYIDSILGFNFYFKINEDNNLYSESFDTFKKNSLNYLLGKFGPYKIIYCKPYSDKIKKITSCNEGYILSVQKQYP